MEQKDMNGPNHRKLLDHIDTLLDLMSPKFHNEICHFINTKISCCHSPQLFLDKIALLALHQLLKCPEMPFTDEKVSKR